MRVRATEIDPDAHSKTWDERWAGPDGGLLAAWMRGREKATEEPTLAAAAKRGELVTLPWKGGVAQAPKSGRKYGSLLYLAMWCGLRGDPLDIDTDQEVSICCTRSVASVTFTADPDKYGQAS